MTTLDFKAINEQIELLEQRRSKFKSIGIACGVGAVFPIWTVLLGPFAFFGWLAALVCGFAFRNVAVKARNEAMRLRLSIANLQPSTYMQAAPAASNAPKAATPKAATPKTAAPKAAAKPKTQTTSSRLDKARRRED